MAGQKESIFEGKTLDDAVRMGLNALGLSRAEVMITVMEEGSGGFLGLGARPYRVRMMPRPGGAPREGGDRPERGGRGDRDRDRGRGGRGRRDGGGSRAEGRGAPPREGRGAGRDRGRNGREPIAAGAPRRSDAGDEQGAPRAGATPRRSDVGDEQGGPRAGATPRRSDVGDEQGGPRAGAIPRPEAYDEEGSRRRRRGRRGGRGRGGDRPLADASAVAVAPPDTASPLPGEGLAAPGAESHLRPEGAEREGRSMREGRGRDTGREAVPAGPILPAAELEALAVSTTQRLLEAMGFEARVSARAEGPNVDVTVEVSQGEVLLIGPKGEVRQALQHLLNLMVNRGGAMRHHLQLEINDFWRQREAELETLARSMADQAVATGREQKTEYLNAQERRIIHVTLRDDTRVKTYAIGDGLIKRLAVAPADYAEGSRQDE